MKKNIFLGIAALSVLFGVSSCANETRETAAGNKGKISFKTTLGKQTRASEFTYWTSGESFPVEAYETGTTGAAFMAGTLTYDGTNWSYGTPVAQPGYSLTYYAWYPTTTVASITADGTGGTLAYTIPAPQEDLVAATIATAMPTVGLEFNHILSQVNFAIQGVDGVLVKLENIRVNTVQNAGTYTFGGNWALGAGTGSYVYTPAVVAGDETDYTTDGTTDILYLGNTGNIGTGANNANTNALMLMPQTFAANDDKTFSFDFTLSDAVAPYTEQASGSVTVDLSELSTAWAMGKRYLYIIDFTDYLVGGDIKFTVTVNGWTDETTYIAQTVPVADATQLSIEAAIDTQGDANVATRTLTVFPIAVPTDLTAAMQIATINGTKFDQNDQIRLEFPSDLVNINFISLSASVDADWILGSTGRVVTLTKK